MNNKILHNTPALKKKLKKRDIVEYISGFVDGEGCFSVSFSKRPKLNVKWEVKPSFSTSQNADRSEVLYLMQDYFESGHIRRDYSDKTLKYEVRKINDLINKVIPHFEKFPIISSKSVDFEIFKKICLLVIKREHVTPKGFSKIVDLAFKMNPSTRRRYTKQDIFNFAKF